MILDVDGFSTELPGRSADVRFVGGLTVPSAVGRLNATWPLAELTIRNDEVVLRPRGFASWFYTEFAVPISSIVAAYPLRGKTMTSGVGLAMTDGDVAYFWTFSPDPVLAWLASVGVSVDPQARRATGLWRWWRRPGAAATRTPRLTRPVVVLYPLLLVVSVPVLLWLLATSPSAWFAWFVVVSWAVGTVICLRIWWRSR